MAKGVVRGRWTGLSGGQAFLYACAHVVCACTGVCVGCARCVSTEETLGASAAKARMRREYNHDHPSDTGTDTSAMLVCGLGHHLPPCQITSQRAELLLRAAQGWEARPPRRCAGVLRDRSMYAPVAWSASLPSGVSCLSPPALGTRYASAWPSHWSAVGQRRAGAAVSACPLQLRGPQAGCSPGHLCGVIGFVDRSCGGRGGIERVVQLRVTRGRCQHHDWKEHKHSGRDGGACQLCQRSVAVLLRH